MLFHNVQRERTYPATLFDGERSRRTKACPKTLIVDFNRWIASVYAGFQWFPSVPTDPPCFVIVAFATAPGSITPTMGTSKRAHPAPPRRSANALAINRAIHQHFDFLSKKKLTDLQRKSDDHVRGS